MFSTIERQLFEQNLAVQLVVDPRDGTIVGANRAASEFYGGPLFSLEGRSVSELSMLPEEDTLQLLEIASAVGAHAHAIPHRHVSGEPRLVEIHAGPITTDHGTFTHLIVHDVTERVRAEDEARELHAERAVTRRTAALQEALRRRETLSRMGELVAGVAHEVRTPLFAISSTLDALRARVGDQPELQRHFASLTAQVERLNALMHDLLEYGKPAELAWAPIDLDSLLAGVVELTRGSADTASVQVTAKRQSELATIDGDRSRLLQVLQNLVANAIQHSPRGGAVEVQLRDARVGSEPAVEIQVSDGGPGFPDDALPHLFEPFFSRRPGGTGLGLAIAHRLVSDHGGTIDASNLPHGGARVAIRLLAKRPLVSASDDSPPRSTPAKGHHA